MRRRQSPTGQEESATCRPLLGRVVVSPQFTNLRLHHVRYRIDEVLALETLAARGAFCQLLGVGFAPIQIIEKHPLVRPSDPPYLPPDFVLLLTRAIQRGH